MDQFETSPSASLNRVQIVDLPGLPRDAAVRGRRGNELVSNRALMALAVEHADALGLPAEDLPAATPLLPMPAPPRARSSCWARP